MGSVKNRQMLADNRTQYKALLMDYDWIFSLPENGCLYCLSGQQVALLLASVEMYKWQTRWNSPTDSPINEGEILRLVEGIESELMSPKCDDIRTEFWRIRVAQTDIINQQRHGRYDGTAQSVNSNCPGVGENFDYAGGAGDAALCAAARVYVCLKLIETYNLMLASLAAAAAATGLLAALTGGLGAIPGGAVVLLAGLALASVEAALADEAAIIDVACDLYQALQGVECSEANFWIAINGLSVGTGTRATIVGILQSSLNQNVYNWYHFLEILGQAKVSQDGLDDCPCEAVWCHQWLSGLGHDEWSLIDYIGCTPSWVDDKMEGCTPSPANAVGGAIELTVTPSRTLTRVQAYVTWNSTRSGGTDGAQIKINDTIVASHSWEGGSGVGSVTLDTGAISVSAGDVRVQIFARNNNSSDGSYARIEIVTIEGLGTSPYGEDNCT